MAWTPPKTDFSPGNVLTADQMNNIGANLLSGTAATCGAFHNTTQSIANLTFQALAFNSEFTSWDTDSVHSTVTNNSRFTLTDAGIYLATCSISFAANATGARRFVAVRLDGTAYQAICGSYPQGGNVTQVSGSWLINVTSTTGYLEFMAFQDVTPGAALNVLADDPTTSGTYCRAAVQWLGTLG